MDRERKLIANFLEQEWINPESVPGQAIIEIAGERRVLIENHHGVAEYGKDRITVNVKYGCIYIGGCNLEILHMNRDQLVITGKIDSVNIRRRR